VNARLFSSFFPEIQASQLQITRTDQPKDLVPKEDLVFGTTFSDHMLEVDWYSGQGWTAPRIVPYQNFSMSPAASVLHYALECFEGMKAYKDAEGRIRLFRPLMNMARMNSSMARLYMPAFDSQEFLKCMEALLKVDERWIPEGDGYSIYIRPTAISTYPFLGVGATKQIKLYAILSPVGPYYSGGFKPIRLYASDKYVRAWPGGVGNTKLGGNYAPTIRPQAEAQEKGCSQVMWLFGEQKDITEVGAMNLFFVIRNPEGQTEVVTAPLSRGDILPGVTRASIVERVRSWNDPSIVMREESMNMGWLRQLAQEGNLLEVFGAGTAVIVSPVKSILYDEEEILVPTGEEVGSLTKRIWDEITGIQYGKIESEWSHLVA
jgi:branched-chain amino acid aminotransferase